MPVYGLKSFWLYDNYERAKKEMLDMLKEHAVADEYGDLFDGEEGYFLPLERWLEDRYNYNDVPDEWGYRGEDMHLLPEILRKYIMQDNFDPAELKKQWYGSCAQIQNIHSPEDSFIYRGLWNEDHEDAEGGFEIQIHNPDFDPEIPNTVFRAWHKESEYSEEIWLKLEIIRLEVNEPRV